MISDKDSSIKNSRSRFPEELARWLDDELRLPGTDIRVGWDVILGLIPGIGDSITSFLAGLIIYQAYKRGVPGPILARMGLNVLIDLLIGSIPLVGDVADIFWRANRRNVKLLEKYESAPARVHQRSRWFWIGVATVLTILLALLVWVAVTLTAWLWEVISEAFSRGGFAI